MLVIRWKGKRVIEIYFTQDRLEQPNMQHHKTAVRWKASVQCVS